MADINKYKPTFRKVWLFMEKYLNTKTDDEWGDLIDGLEGFKSEFEIELVTAVVSEIEKIYALSKENK